MSLKLGALDPKWIILAAGVALLLYELKKGVAAAANALPGAAAAVGAAVDPTNPNNLAYSGVNKVVGALTGDQNETLGGWLYDLTHPSVNPPMQVLAPTATKDPVDGMPYTPAPGALQGDSSAWGLPL
jgi:hypothetical protein